MFMKPIRISLAVTGLLSVFGLSLAGSSSSPSYSFTPAEFTPYFSDCYYSSYGYSLDYKDGTTTGCDVYYAGIHLPDGITVTKMTLFFNDASTESMTAYFVRNDFNKNPETLAGVGSSGNSSGNTSISIDTSIPIDNSTYSYYFSIHFPSENIELLGITLETTYPTFLSIINK
jgi:hypothetical protein